MDKMASKIKIFMFLLFVFVNLTYSHTTIPVIIWGTDSLSGVSPASLGEVKTQKFFKSEYVDPLVDKEGHNIIMFLQDHLSLDDITLNCEVFSGSVDGTDGPCQNLRRLTESHPSATLPSVKSPVGGLGSLRRFYRGKKHQLTAPYDVTSLALKEGGDNLIVVKLPGGIKAADPILGAVSDAVKSLGWPFTALYMGQKPAMVVPESLHASRHLLADDGSLNATFFNLSNCVYFYTTQVSLQLTKKKEKGPKWQLPNVETFDAAASQCTNDTATLAWEYKNATEDLAKLAITMNFHLTRAGYWHLTKLLVSFSSNVSADDDCELRSREVFAPKGFSYHCTQSDGFLQFRNASDTKGDPWLARLFFKNFQVQFGGLAKEKFGRPNDCQGFFSIPILSGLFVSLILIAIFTFGILMVSSINTMDRFDDPKGKTITVTVGE